MSFGPGLGPHDDPDLLLAIALSKSLICDETEPAPSGDEKQPLAADDGDEWEQHANQLASFLRETVGALDSGSVDRLPVALPVLAELMEVCLTSTLSTEQWSFLAEVAEATVAALFRVPNGMHDLHRMSRLFLEVSAHPVVSHSIAETLVHHGYQEHAVVPVLRRDQPERRAIGAAVAALYCHGAPVEHDFTKTAAWAADLPGTVWQHRRFWRTPTAPPGTTALHDVAAHTLLGGCIEVSGPVPTRVWQTRLDMGNRPKVVHQTGLGWGPGTG